MLINFTVKNFRSFKDEQTLFLDAYSKEGAVKTGFNKAPNILPTTAIYGANASGKSNVILAMMYMKDFVTNGFTKYKPREEIETETFKLSESTINAPSRFEITFIHKDKLYNYGFEVDATKVLEEWLYEISNKPSQKKQTLKTILEREYDEELEDYTYRPQSVKKSWKASVRSNALSLSTAAYHDDDEAKDVFEWFSTFLRILPNNSELSPSFTMDLSTKVEHKKFIHSIIKKADIGIENFKEIDIEIKEEDINFPDGFPDALKSKIIGKQKTVEFTHKSADPEHNTLGLGEQSLGTEILLGLAGPISDVIQNGYTLIVDELEKSLHPHLVEEILNIFNDPEVNKNGAQLLFTAHNSYFMKCMNRDQIWFSQKDDCGVSTLIGLLEYKPRKNESIEKNYNSGNYAGIPHITGLIEHG